jgi:hypothetical protein
MEPSCEAISWEITSLLKIRIELVATYMQLCQLTTLDDILRNNREIKLSPGTVHVLHHFSTYTFNLLLYCLLTSTTEDTAEGKIIPELK